MNLTGNPFSGGHCPWKLSRIGSATKTNEALVNLGTKVFHVPRSAFGAWIQGTNWFVGPASNLFPNEKFPIEESKVCWVPKPSCRCFIFFDFCPGFLDSPGWKLLGLDNLPLGSSRLYPLISLLNLLTFELKEKARWRNPLSRQNCCVGFDLSNFVGSSFDIFFLECRRGKGNALHFF